MRQHIDAPPRAQARLRLFAVLLAASLGSACAENPYENVTAALLDRTGFEADYRFDALWSDFDGDGCYDAFLFDHAPAASRLWMNRCDGSERMRYVDNEAVQHHIAQPQSPRGTGWVTLVDFDGDGDQDLWLRDADLDAAVYVNDTAPGADVPRFSEKRVACGARDTCAFADIDGDGQLDIVHNDRRVERASDRRRVLPAEGTPALRIAGDIDGDSWPDLVEPGRGGAWMNRGGELEWRALPELLGDQLPMALADLDGDGALDLVTFTGGRCGGDGGKGRAHLFRNAGDGTFSAVADSGLEDVPFIPCQTGYGVVIAADMDNDGRQDLVFTGAGDDVSILLNQGGLAFEDMPGLDFDGIGSPAKSRADVADLDGDGRLDIVKTQADTGIGLWRSRVDVAGRHWMRVRVRGPGRNTDGIGTRLTWYRAGGDARIVSIEVQANHQHAQTWVHTGVGDAARVDLVVRLPNDAGEWRFDDLAVDQELIVFADGCAIERWKPGHGWPLESPPDCALRGERVGDAPASSDAAFDDIAPPMRPGAVPDAVLDDAALRTVTLQRNGATAADVDVVFGIPLPPGALHDAANLRLLDERGDELPAHVEPTLRWHFVDDSLRAVRVSMRLRLDGGQRRLHFALGAPRTREGERIDYARTLVMGAEGVRIPGVLALLTPEWMSASRIAGPQRAAVPPDAYDAYYARQFEWARALPRGESSAWLFDRTTALFKQYVRTGRADYLAAATASYRFYMAQIERGGVPVPPVCGGGWRYDRTEPCDTKYLYIQPIVLALGIAGDDSEHDAALVERMVSLLDSGGWSGIVGPYTRADQAFTERQVGLGLLGIVAAYELLGRPEDRDRIERRVGWLAQHQSDNPDGLPADGSWRHSWHRHENLDYVPGDDVRGASPWMSENIVDALWHAWLVTADARIPPMLVGFGRYLEEHGWIDPAVFERAGHSWRDDCSGPDGPIAWYWSSSLASEDTLIAMQDEHGWYSDSHTVQLALPMALARYFDDDRSWQRRYDARLDTITHGYAPGCAASSSTPRRFNWNHRGAGAVRWLVEQPAGSG